MIEFIIALFNFTIFLMLGCVCAIIVAIIVFVLFPNTFGIFKLNDYQSQLLDLNKKKDRQKGLK